MRAASYAARMFRFCAASLLLWLAASAPLRAQDAPTPPAAAEAPSKTDAQRIDELFDRLGKTEDDEESSGIVLALQRLWLHSGSDSADLLMSRAITAMESQNYPLALQLLDSVVASYPDWAEGWNKRATARFYAGDAEGSMADIAETLKRNPRHIGALSGLGAILDNAGLKENALRAYEQGLALAPHYPPLVESAKRLRASLSGRSL